MRQRGGPLRLVRIEDNKAESVLDVIYAHVDKGVEKIMTDESPIYNFKLTKYHRARHKRIKHKNKVCVRRSPHEHY